MRSRKDTFSVIMGLPLTLSEWEEGITKKNLTEEAVLMFQRSLLLSSREIKVGHSPQCQHVPVCASGSISQQPQRSGGMCHRAPRGLHFQTLTSEAGLFLISTPPFSKYSSNLQKTNDNLYLTIVFLQSKLLHFCCILALICSLLL